MWKAGEHSGPALAYIILHPAADTFHTFFTC